MTSPQDDGDLEATSKFANTNRGPRIRGYGEGTVYEFERRLPSGVLWRGFRAKRSIKHGERTYRIAGQGRTRQEALDSLERNITKKRVALGELPHSHLKLTEADEVRTFERVANEWLLRQKSKIRLNSWKGYSAKVRLYLVPKFGNAAIRLLDSRQLDTYFTVELPNVRSKTGSPLGESSVRSTYWAMHAILQYALKREYIDKNPLLAVDPPQRRKVTKLEEQTLREAAYWVAQHTIKRLQGDENEARWMLAFIGLRQSEALGLQLDSIKKPNKKRGALLMIRQQLVYETADHGCGFDGKGKWACGRSSANCPERIGEAGFRLAEELKTAEGDRALPLTDRMYKVLQEHVARRQKLTKAPKWSPLPGFENLLFTDDTGKPIRHQVDRRAWKAMMEKFEVRAPLRLHHARHFAATMLFQNEVPRAQIMQILGWSAQSTDAMIKTYAHADLAAMLSAPMDQLDSKLFERVDRDELEAETQTS